MAAGSHDPSRPGDEFLAALRGLLSGLGAPPVLTPALVAVLLERVGDVLRLGRSLPAEARRLCGELSESSVGAALEVLRDQAAGWLRPATEAPEVDGRFIFGVRCRDEAQSALVAVRWLGLEQDWALDELAGLAPCLAALRQYDDALAVAFDRGAVEAMLEDRIPLVERGGWTARFAEAALPADADAGELAGTPPPGSPSDEVVQEYIGAGAHRLYVEGCAARSPEFAADLADCIDTLGAAREERSLVARVWRSRHQGQAPERSPVAYDVPPALLALAAASPDEQPPAVVITLGPIPGLPAEANLELRAGIAELFVFSAVPLARIELGDSASDRPSGERRWSVVSRIGPGSLRIRVAATDGRVFEAAVELVPAGP